MGIQFHCEHCRKVIVAPDEAGGRSGKCPACGGSVYVPNPEATDEEIPLAPLDTEEERHNQQAAQEAWKLQYQLLHEQATPGEPAPRKSTVRTPDAKPTAGLSVKELNRLVVEYVEAMAGGKLETAQKTTARLIPQRLQVYTILDNMATEDLSAYGMPTLPRPVLLGFLKSLRAELQKQ